ncbi:MAG: ureidoglycolate lyase [Alphaproteobacteria bacterium]
MAGWRILDPKPLTADAFAPFGDVLAVDLSAPDVINDGYTERFADLAGIDVAEAGGRPLVHLYRTRRFELPRSLTMMERHPKGSQAFMPLDAGRYVAVVAPADVAAPGPDDVRAFLCGPGQGLNLRRGVWHHPMMPVDGPMTLFVIERGADDANCDIVALAKDAVVVGR